MIEEKHEEEKRSFDAFHRIHKNVLAPPEEKRMAFNLWPAIGVENGVYEKKGEERTKERKEWTEGMRKVC